MKTTVDFENELIDNISKYFEDYTLINKIPKTNSYFLKTAINNNDEDVVLKKVFTTKDIIDFNFNVIKKIENIKLPKSFLIENIIATIEEEPFIVVNDNTYATFKDLKGISLDLTKNIDIQLYFSTLKQLQASLSLIATEDLEQNIKTIDFDTEKLTKTFIKLKKQAQSNKKKSDFDFAFLKDFNQRKNKIKEIEETLKTFDLYKNRKLSVIYNGTSIYKNNDIGIIKTPTTFTKGYYMVDIYNFIMKYLKKSTLNDILPFDSILNFYDPSFSDEEKEILKLLLQYPFKYINIMIQYYEKKRVFVPTYIKTELIEILEQDKKIQKLLSL